MLFYTGLVLMAVSAVLGAVLLTVFLVTGRKLKRTLEEEYGKLQK